MLNQLPQYASDVAENVRKIFFQESNTLAKYQIFGIVLTAGYALKHECLLNYIRPEAKRYLDDDEINACKIVASTTSMTNAYYKFSEKIDDEEIKKMPPLFSLENSSSHNIDEKDFLIYRLVASIINDCKFCINVHISKLRNKNCLSEVIRDIGKIVSVTKAVGDILDIERMRSYDFIAREENF